MLGILSGAILNISLDPLFIFYLDMGISGAGLATLISQAVSFSVLLTITLRMKSWQIGGKNKDYIALIVKGGTPSITRQGLGTLATLFLNLTAAGFGDAAVAAMSIVTRITFLVYSIVIGLGHGFQPFCGYC
jgi:Na+-driven multidrug efflux pump